MCSLIKKFKIGKFFYKKGLEVLVMSEIFVKMIIYDRVVFWIVVVLVG